jgi:hypothetical protein
MKSKLLIYALPVLLVMALVYGYSSQNDPRLDAAPQSTTSGQQSADVSKLILTSETDTLVPAGFPVTLWNYNFSTNPSGQSAGSVGAAYFGGKYINNRWNLATLYRLNPDGQNGGAGTIADSNTAYNGGTGAIRDMTTAPDGSGTMYLWGGAASTALYKMDENGNRIATYTHAGAAYRTIAWDPNRKGFWSSNFSDNLVCRDTNGVILKTLVNTLPGKYGMAFDSTSAADSSFLWVWSQGATTGAPNTLNRIHIESNTNTKIYTVPLVGGTLGIAGGAETYVKDNKFMLNLNYQNYAIVGYVLKELGPPPPMGGTTLVLIHDSTTSTAQRTADRDTLNRYLTSTVGNYTLATFTATSDLPDLTSYNTIVLQETSFDAVAVRYLSPSARTALKAWLTSGTAASKKSLISIGADQGYNYSRATSPAQDLDFAGVYSKFVYKVDNGSGTVTPSITGTGIDVGNMRNLSSTPPGGSYWPDGCSMEAAGISLYRYQNHTALDTLAAIGNVQTGYNVATMFVDPRYFTGEFGSVMNALVGWVISNGGLITGVGSGNTAEINIPESYKLSQNYPNPFNPSTKISFTIPKSELVTLRIYNILGKEVMTLVNEVKNAGTFEVQFDASNLSSGAYFYRLETGNFVDTKKMMLMK